MNKNIRHISMMLAIFMVLSLLAAFPALSVGAADPVNLALTATYRAAEPSSTNGTSGKFSEENMAAPGDWNAYHTGKLADGVFTTEATNNTDRATIEIAGGEGVAAKVGTITIYFKLAKESTVSSANIFANDRASNYRGYADSYSVYVGNSEDVASATLLGTVTEDTYTAYQESATAREYVVTGEASLTGTYVILQCDVDSVAVGPDAAKGIIALMEVQIWGEESEATSSSEESSVESSEESGDVSGDESGDVSGDEPVDTPAAPLANIAGNAQYKGTEGDDNGTSGNYCDTPIGEWLNYHNGKLNDGVIPEGDSDATKGQNVEIWNAALSSGYNTVIFKLEEAADIKQVNVYMNNRTSNANTGYPEKIEIYVGSDEDMANATLMGEATTTDPEGAVRLYSVDGNVNGSYVFIYFTVGAKWRITLSEVEIMVDDTPVNHAPYAEYKGEGNDNGTSGSYCELDAEWHEYHTGKLNDGTIATDASNTVTGVNVEFFNDNYSYGTNQLTFKFDYEVYVTDIVAYFNTRTTGGNRGYPSKVNVYVGNSEDVATATLLGEATTTDTGYVRAYRVSGAAYGTYVIFEIDITDPVTVVALTEVEIMACGDIPEPEVPALPELSAPVLSGNLTKLETYDAPTITWEAVEGAVSYDAYIDGVLVTEGITGTSYVPDMDPVVNYGSNTSYTKVQIVAKGDGVTYADSARSESYNFFYVEKPLDLRGNRVTSADILIDPGHGGSQPGACLDDRQEKNDTLAMSLKLGEYFEAMGYTVAFCRIEDVDDGLMSRAAKANAGDFRLFICVHRNAFNNLAQGIETLHEAGDATDAAFAQKVQDEFVALNLFKNRGLKPRDNLVVTNNVADTIPCILVEMGFVDNVEDNTTFDTYFNDLALAVVKGSMNYLGDDTGVSGSVTVEDLEYTIGETESVDVAIDDDNSIVTIKGTLTSAFGVSALLSAIGEDEATEITFTANDDGSVSFEIEFDFSDYEEGTYTIVINGKNDFAEKVLILNGFDVITVNVTVPSKALIGDVNNDGVIDNLDAAMVLQYDVALIDEIDMELGDVNFDGEVDSLDAAQILRFEANLIDGFVKPEDDSTVGE